MPSAECCRHHRVKSLGKNIEEVEERVQELFKDQTGRKRKCKPKEAQRVARKWRKLSVSGQQDGPSAEPGPEKEAGQPYCGSWHDGDQQKVTISDDPRTEEQMEQPPDATEAEGYDEGLFP